MMGGTGFGGGMGMMGGMVGGMGFGGGMFGGFGGAAASEDLSVSVVGSVARDEPAESPDAKSPSVESQAAPSRENPATHVDPLENPENYAIDFDSIINQITSLVMPQSWDEVGGPCAINDFPTTLDLLISGSPAIHAEVESLLAQLRQVADLSPESHGMSAERVARRIDGRGDLSGLLDIICTF